MEIRNFYGHMAFSVRLSVLSQKSDTGTYTLLDKDDDVVASYEGYVPDVLDLGGDGYGDYLNFEVKNEQIEEWKWNEELFEQFMENVTEEY